MFESDEDENVAGDDVGDELENPLPRSVLARSWSDSTKSPAMVIERVAQIQHESTCEPETTLGLGSN